MRRDFLLGLAAFSLILTGLVTLNGVLLALAIPFAVYLAAALIASPSRLDFAVERKLSAERVPVGSPVVVTVTITNQGARVEEALIEERLPEGLSILAGASRHLVHLAAGERISWEYTIAGVRGYYQLPDFTVRATDPFGLLPRAAVVHVPGRLFVMPPILKLKPLMIRPRKTRVYSGVVPARVGGYGVEFYGLRDYQPGDSPRWINWRASARQAENLYSNEFQQERVADVGIILDGRVRANVLVEGRSLFEYSTIAAATVSGAFLQQGNRVGLLVYGHYLQWTLPGYGKLQREKILQAISQAQPGSSQVFADLDHIPTRLFPAQSQLVLISPLTLDDHEILLKLRARGYQLMIISPDPVAFEASFLPQTGAVELSSRVIRMERELMLHRLRRAGIQLVNWDVSQPFDQVMRSRLSHPVGWLPAPQGGSG